MSNDEGIAVVCIKSNGKQKLVADHFKNVWIANTNEYWPLTIEAMIYFFEHNNARNDEN